MCSKALSLHIVRACTMFSCEGGTQRTAGGHSVARSELNKTGNLLDMVTNPLSQSRSIDVEDVTDQRKIFPIQTIVHDWFQS